MKAILLTPYLRSVGRNARLGILAVSLGLALWSANAGTQAMMAALNIAYEEPERRSLFQYYLNAFTFTIIGILGGVVVLLAIVYVPILFALTGYSNAFELVVLVWCAGRSWRSSYCSYLRSSTAMALAAAAPNGTG